MKNKLNNKRFENIKSILWILWGLSLSIIIIFSFNSYFVGHHWSLDHEDATILNYIYIVKALSIGGRFFYVGDSYNIILVILLDLLMFFVLFSLIISISSKPNFLKSENKLSNAIFYIISSFSTLILGIVIYIRGSLVSYEDIYITHGDNGNIFDLIYYLKRSFVPALYGLILLLMDIPYLILGIKDYKKRNKDNINKTSFKNKISSLFNNPTNCVFMGLIIISIILLISLYFSPNSYYPEKVKIIYYN